MVSGEIGNIVRNFLLLELKLELVQLVELHYVFLRVLRLPLMSRYCRLLLLLHPLVDLIEQVLDPLRRLHGSFTLGRNAVLALLALKSRVHARLLL